MLTLFVVALALAGEPSPQDAAKPFDLPSVDGTILHGQADMPNGAASGAAILVAGTGGFDRDTTFGRSGTARDKIFKDLGERLTRRGMIAVRYDKRGVKFGVSPAEANDKKASAGVTTQTQLDDLRTIYDWTRSSQGLGARCVVLFAHSEGLLHIGRMAAAGAPAPNLVMAMGGLAVSPASVLKWQMSERDAYSILQLDKNHDGVTTNEEVEAHWRETPSGGVLDKPDKLLNPNGRWTKSDIKSLRDKEAAEYDQQKRSALAMADTDPWPDATISAASFQWWKSWFLDDTPTAKNLSKWNTRFEFHYGSVDSQTNAQIQTQAIRRYLPAGQVQIEIHPGRGHGLGESPLFGPIDGVIADELADHIASACKS